MTTKTKTKPASAASSPSDRPTREQRVADAERTEVSPILYREMSIAIEQRAESQAADDDRIPISISSETPVERIDWWDMRIYHEVLGHDAGEVDLSRAKDGLPFLVDHSTRDLVAIVEDVALGADGKLRGMVRSSRSQRGQEIRQDMLDGIRKKISVGYRVHEMKLVEESEEKGDTYRVTSWTPLEASTVAIPADDSVGVNRSADGAAYPVRVIPRNTSSTHSHHRPHEAKEHTVKDTDTAARNGAAPGGGSPAVTTEERSATTDTRSEQQKISDLCRMHGLEKEGMQWLSEGRSYDAVRDQILARAAKNLEGVAKPVVTMTAKEERQYSVLRAIAGQVGRATGEKFEDDGFEREISSEIQRKLPEGYQQRGGFFMPTSLRAPITSGTATSAAELVFKEQGSFIDLLRAMMMVRQLGATYLAGLVGPVDFPKQTGAGAFTWVGENPGADVAESNLTTALIALASRTGQSTQAVTKQLLRQANSVDAEQLVRRDIAANHALGVDKAALNGSGAGAEPRGVLNAVGIGSVAIGANGGVPTYDHLVDLETAVAQANADPLGTRAFLTTAGIRGRLRKTQQFAGTDGSAVWGKGANGEGDVLGYRAGVTEQLPKNLVKGTSTDCHPVIYGIWSQLLIGEWGALEILVDPYAKKKQGIIELTSFQMIGLAVRYAEAFAAIKDARIA